MTQVSGVFLVDKPPGWTSHDVVGRARRIFGTRKVGHAGTLDPMATGLLVLGIGRSTRLLTYLVGLDKTYTATVRLGQSTASDDREGEITATAPAETVRELAANRERIEAAISQLTGDIEQVPAKVSAIKVDGKRAYELARKGEQVNLKARPIHVAQFDLLSAQTVTLEPLEADAHAGGVAIDLEVEVSCSSGTYVRALARDLGELLGVGGHLTELRRTRVGDFTIAEAATLDADGERPEVLTPAAVATRVMPVLKLSPQQVIDCLLYTSDAADE